MWADLARLGQSISTAAAIAAAAGATTAADPESCEAWERLPSQQPQSQYQRRQPAQPLTPQQQPAVRTDAADAMSTDPDSLWEQLLQAGMTDADIAAAMDWEESSPAREVPAPSASGAMAHVRMLRVGIAPCACVCD